MAAVGEIDAQPSSESDTGNRRASWLELFFDLVFALAVSQLDSGFRGHPSATRAVVMVGLFVPVWWAWVGFAFFATRFEDQDGLFRAGVLAAMAATLVLAASINSAFAGRTAMFAIGYALIRFALVALYLRERRQGSAQQRAVAQGLVGNFALGAVLWLISAAAPAPWRYALWAVSIAIDVGAPLMRGGALAQVPVDASHLPERFGLFVIIVLGDAVVTTGTGLAGIRPSASSITVACACFVVAAVIWWAYFDRAESILRAHVDESEGSGVLARDVYSYAHFPIVVGITFAAAGARLLLTGQSGAAAGKLALCLGLATVFGALLLIQLILRRRTVSIVGVRVAGTGLLIALAAISETLSPPVTAGLAAAIGVALIVCVDRLSRRRTADPNSGGRPDA